MGPQYEMINVREFTGLLGLATLFLVIAVGLLALVAWALSKFLPKEQVFSEATLKIATAFILTFVFGVMSFFLVFDEKSTYLEKDFAMTILLGLLAFWGFSFVRGKSKQSQVDHPQKSSELSGLR